MRASVWARALAAAAVPSGESSSTMISCQRTPARAAAISLARSARLAASLKAGTTMLSSKPGGASADGEG
jgi:hypothetical protein